MNVVILVYRKSSKKSSLGINDQEAESLEPLLNGKFAVYKNMLRVYSMERISSQWHLKLPMFSHYNYIVLFFQNQLLYIQYSKDIVETFMDTFRFDKTCN